MVFSEFLGAISFLHPQFDDDFVDRFHYYYTSTFLILTSVSDNTFKKNKIIFNPSF